MLSLKVFAVRPTPFSSFCSSPISFFLFKCWSAVFFLLVVSKVFLIGCLQSLFSWFPPIIEFFDLVDPPRLFFAWSAPRLFLCSTCLRSFFFFNFLGDDDCQSPLWFKQAGSHGTPHRFNRLWFPQRRTLCAWLHSM